MFYASLPVLMALSWVPMSVAPSQPAQPAQKADMKRVQTAQAETITCPVTGEQIPSCCCPAKK